MRMPIAYAINNGYTKVLMAQLIPLYENSHTDTIYDLYILNYKLDISHRKLIVDLVKKLKPEAVVTFLDVSEKQKEAIPDIEPWGRETNYRGLLPDFLPSLDKILYLDADTLVLGDLKHLLRLDISQNSFAAVADYFATNRNVIELASYEENMAIEQVVNSFGYINAGVLLINLDYWRMHQWQSKFIRLLGLIQEKQIDALPDQDVLNYLAIKDGVNTICYMPSTYNSMYTFGTQSKDDRVVDMERHRLHHILFSRVQRSKRDSYVDKDCDILDRNTLTILHFVGYKPWTSYRHSDYFVSLFQPYADRVGLCLPSRKRKLLSFGKIYKKIKPYKKYVIVAFCLNLLVLMGISFIMYLLLVKGN